MMIKREKKKSVHEEGRSEDEEDKGCDERKYDEEDIGNEVKKDCVKIKKKEEGKEGGAEDGRGIKKRDKK